MSSKNKSPVCAAELREQAEELARRKEAEQPKNIVDLSPEEAQQAHHELRVHQIELEMQNAALRKAQVELDEARACYFDLYDLAPVGYCTISEQGLILKANLMVVSLLGLTSQSALAGRPFSPFVFKDDQDSYYLHRKQLFETSELQSFELRLVKMDGALFWARLQAVVAQDGEGRPTCRVVVSDISAAKLAEEALNDSELRYRALFSSVSDPVLVADASTGIIDECNEAAERYFGRSREQLIGMPQQMLQPPGAHEAAGITDDFREHVAENGSIKEVKLLAASGKIRLVAMQGHVFELKGQKFILGVFRDITEQRLTDEVLEESRQALKAIVDALPANLCVLDNRGNFLLVNKAWGDFARGNGFSSDACFEGVNYLEVCHAAKGSGAAEAVTFANGVSQVLRGQLDAFTMDYSCNSPDQVRWFTGYVSPIPSGDSRGAVVAHVDITDRMVAELALRQANEQLELRVVKRTRKIEESNTALRVVLEMRGKDRQNLEEHVLASIRLQISPCIEQMRKELVHHNINNLLGHLQSCLEDITSPFSHRLNAEYQPLTPTEIRVAGMIRSGMASKDIAEALHISIRTAEYYRRRLREKLRLSGKNTNLNMHLNRLSEYPDATTPKDHLKPPKD